MTKKQFKHDFLRGLGSALIELQSNENPKQFYDTVLYGCLHNTTYDMQCEGDRGWYLYQAAQFIGEKESIESAVIQKFFRIKEDHWLFDQLTSILYNFAADGSEAARAALYQQYDILLNELSPRKRKNNGTYPRRDMFDRICVWLTSLDGWSMFKRIVRDISEILLPKDGDCFFSEWFYGNSKGKFGQKRTEAYLHREAKTSKFIAAYLQKAQEWDNYVYEKRPDPTLEEVIAGVGGGRFRGRGLSMRFCRNANSDDLEKLFQIAMAEQDLTRRAELIWGFRRAPALIPEEAITEMLQSENKDIRDTAFYIMGSNPSPKTRELALSLIKSGEDVENGLFLLSKNPRPADDLVIYNIAKSFTVRHNERDWHGVFMDVKDSIEVMRGKPKTDILEYLYRQTLCGTCREWIVRLMHKKKVLPIDILRECRFDSNSDIRKFAERVMMAKEPYRAEKPL